MATKGSRGPRCSLPSLLAPVALALLLVAAMVSWAFADIVIPPRDGAAVVPTPSPWQSVLPALGTIGLSLALTLVIEVPVVAIAGRGDRRAIAAGVLANTLTNPIVVLAVLVAGSQIARIPAPIWLLGGIAALEIGVVIVEWRLYRGVLGWASRHALLTSALANALSFGVGVVLWWRQLP